MLFWVLESLGVLTLMCLARSDNQNKDLTKKQVFFFFLCVTEHLQLKIILLICKKHSAYLIRAKTNANKKLRHHRLSIFSEKKLICISLDAILWIFIWPKISQKHTQKMNKKRKKANFGSKITCFSLLYT